MKPPNQTNEYGFENHNAIDKNKKKKQKHNPRCQKSKIELKKNKRGLKRVKMKSPASPASLSFLLINFLESLPNKESRNPISV